MTTVCKLLLVEDRDDEVLLFERALQRHPNIRLLGPVGDGDAAIGYLKGAGKYADRTEHPWPDVMVLDLKLPGRDGFDVLQWLNGKEPRPRVGVFTSSDLPQDRKRAEDLGTDLYQQKTLDPHEFDRFLHWLQRLGELSDPEAPIS